MHYQSVKSRNCCPAKGKSAVAIIIDLFCSPALKATIFYYSNFLSIIPFTPNSCAKGGTPPGLTPNFNTYSSPHIDPFLPIHYSFLSLLQLTLRFALQTSRKTSSLPFTNMVLAPHSKGVFLMRADYSEVRVAVCYKVSKGLPSLVRNDCILRKSSQPVAFSYSLWRSFCQVIKLEFSVGGIFEGCSSGSFSICNQLQTQLVVQVIKQKMILKAIVSRIVLFQTQMQVYFHSDKTIHDFESTVTDIFKLEKSTIDRIALKNYCQNRYKLGQSKQLTFLQFSLQKYLLTIQFVRQSPSFNLQHKQPFQAIPIHISSLEYFCKLSTLQARQKPQQCNLFIVLSSISTTSLNQNNIKHCFYNIMYAINFILQLFASLALVTATFYPATASQFQISGRHYTQNTSIRYDWPCFRISFCFDNATKITIGLQDSWNIYQVLIDQKSTSRIQPHKNNKIILFQSDLPQSHCIDFIKITENHYGPLASHKDSTFIGVQVLGGKLIKPKKEFNFLFDFLGDSITTAFGVQSGRNPICFLKMKHIQNCLQSWATHISKKFNADYRVMAVSGKGVFKNAYGILGPKMGNLYTRTTDNSPQFSYKYQDGRLPDAIFILLGANDYSRITAPEPYKFVKAYVEMLITVIKQVKYAFAEASPLLINVCDLGDKKQLCTNIKQAIKQARYAYSNIHYVQIPEGTFPRQNMGCIGHPNSKGQQALADVIYPEVKQMLSAKYGAYNE